MRLLVISDSHGHGYTVDKIIRANPEAGEVFFLGDVVSDIEDLTYEYSERNFHIVRGNCDGFSQYPDRDIVQVNGIDILYTHGNSFGVKGGTDKLLEYAKNSGCKMVLFGHTHIALSEYKNGIYIVNPGSCSKARNGNNSYAVIDVLPNGILTNIIYL